MENTIREYLSQNTSFFNDMSIDEQKLLLNGTFERNFVKGETIGSQGSPCTGVIIVKKGNLRVYILSDEGREVTLYNIGDNEVCVLSASCVLSSITFDVLIEAEEDTTIYQITSSIFGNIAGKNIRVENYMLKQTVERFSDVMWAMQQLLFLAMDKRLAMFLYDETVKNKSLVINVTHENIAKNLGSAREVVTRLLQNFSKNGLVELSRGKITVLDKKALLDIYN
jgi:CRP/FNR family transcriptional regulator